MKFNPEDFRATSAVIRLRPEAVKRKRFWTRFIRSIGNPRRPTHWKSRMVSEGWGSC